MSMSLDSVAQEFANSLPSGDGSREVRLLIVGARETRVYEAQYLQRLRKAIAGDPRIQLFDVTDDVDEYFRQADCLVLTSLNEVTPMVISEVSADTEGSGPKQTFSSSLLPSRSLSLPSSCDCRRRCRGVCRSSAPTSQVSLDCPLKQHAKWHHRSVYIS